LVHLVLAQLVADAEPVENARGVGLSKLQIDASQNEPALTMLAPSGARASSSAACNVAACLSNGGAAPAFSAAMISTAAERRNACNKGTVVAITSASASAFISSMRAFSRISSLRDLNASTNASSFSRTLSICAGVAVSTGGGRLGPPRKRIFFTPA